MATRAQWAVYKTYKDENGERQVERVTETMPRRDAQKDAHRRQAEITLPGQLVHTAPAQFYPVNTVSGKILI